MHACSSRAAYDGKGVWFVVVGFNTYGSAKTKHRIVVYQSLAVPGKTITSVCSEVYRSIVGHFIIVFVHHAAEVELSYFKSVQRDQLSFTCCSCIPPDARIESSLGPSIKN